MKKCPNCAEKIQDAAVTCRYCGAAQPVRESSGSLVLIILGVVAVLGIVGSLMPENDADRANREAREAQQVVDAKADESRVAESKVAGRHCAGLNGEVRSFSGMVKRGLRNPDSFEHVSTQIGPNDKGAHAATMTYRATNAFGAVDTKTAVGEVRNNDCAVRVIDAELGS